MKKAFFLSLLFFVSCGVKTYLLNNGHTKAPVKPLIDLNIENFDSNLNKAIDTNCIYEQFNQNYKVLFRLDNHIETNIYAVLKFYPNGHFNKFYLHRERNQLLKKENFDPSYSGYRGYYNKKDGEIRFNLYAPVTQEREIGKLSGILNIQGDTIYVVTDCYKEAEIFIKRKIPNELLDFKAKW
ncbi:hypothetical protein ACFFLS_11530 [Flavobacterium procerum]|uniref:Lipoprotein n=1 Tax=Flavobacterium procerum TaxID=1455569 RepID=A0ABV6BQF8_9FLAO